MNEHETIEPAIVESSSPKRRFKVNPKIVAAAIAAGIVVVAVAVVKVKAEKEVSEVEAVVKS